MDPALIELNEAGPADEEVSLILRLQDGAEPPPTVRVVCRFGPIITVRCRRADILPTWASDRVISVKAPRAVHLPGPVGARRAPAEIDEAAATEMEMDPQEAEAFAEDGPAGHQQPPAGLPFDGRGVVVGICDWGFDFTHPNFRNADGSTRLIALWDQRGTGDPRAPAPYNRGRLFTPDDINAALAQPDPCAAVAYHPSSGDNNNTGSHGTHVSDIVAGNRRYPGSEVGLASGADLVFVHLGAQRLGELDNLGDSVGLLEGLDFVRRTAAAAGRPCVLHLSAGKTGGPHRGVTLVERAVDILLQETPGIVLVQSGGNYADTAMHTHARIGPDQTHVIDWLIPPGDRTPNELEIWYSGMDVFDVTLVAPDGQEFSAPLAQRARLGDGGDAWGNFYHRLHEPNSGFNHVAIFLYTAAPTGRWKVVVHGRDVVDGRLHAWIERDVGSRYQSRFSRAQATSSYTTNTICNSFRAIAVGAYDATHPERPPGHFSSRGPTADGRQKPEIAAPGVRILAARSMPRDGWNGERKLVVKSGTSMAAPWVSGTVALMFQAAGRPLTIHEVRRILIGTADPHAGPRGRSSSQLGFGYLHTAAAVEAARRLGSGAAAATPPPAVAFSLAQDEALPIESTWTEVPLGEAAVAGSHRITFNDGGGGGAPGFGKEQPARSPPGETATEDDLSEEEELRTWPTLTTLPDSIVDQIVANRNRVQIRTTELGLAPGGYFALGRNIAPTVICSPEEAQNPRLKELLTRLNVELAGEGRTSSVMTGDGAGFTWGRGLAHGGDLEAWVNDWFASCPQAKNALLDLGITLSGTTWKIVDTTNRVAKTGEPAIALINGREPADAKKLLLTIFMNVAEQFGTEAANAQWNVTKRKHFYHKSHGPPKDVIDNPGAWSAKAVCYVIHCAMWGTFAGWQRFKRTGGDSKKILRLEVDYTGFYEKKETFILVPPTFGKGGAISPSGTMLLNMGAGYMINDIGDHIVEPLSALSAAQKGDVVFQMRPAGSKQEFYVLRGVPVVYDPQEEMMDEILLVHGFSMAPLLEYFDKMRDKGGRNKGYARLKAMRDFYASDQNRRKESVGLRPRVAMDAVLHRGEGESGMWLLNDCQNARLPPEQVELIRKKVGLP